MYFDSFAEFFAMGGHGLYVWMSYGAFALIIIWIVIDLIVSRRSNLEKARRVWAREVPKPDSKSVYERDPEQNAGGEFK